MTLGVTFVALMLKVLRSTILLCESTEAKEARVPLYRNLRLEDLLLLPLHLMHWVLVGTLLLMIGYGAWEGSFERAWVARQLDTLGADDAARAVNASVLAAFHSGEGLANLTAVLNATSASFALGEPVSTPALSELLFFDYASAEAYLTPEALEFAAEWMAVQERLEWCFFWGLAFLFLGGLVTIGMLAFYLKWPNHADSFTSDVLWKQSFQAAVAGFLSILDPGFLNAISQDKRGYSIVKRDSAAIMFAFYGAPVVGVTAAAHAGFNCQHRACDIDLGGSYVEYYTIFALVIAVPLCWWHLLSFWTAVVALRSTDYLDDEADKEPDKDQASEALDTLEPPAADNGTTGKWLMLLLSLTYSGAVWFLQLLLLLALYWNSPLATRTVGGLDAHEWGAYYAPETSHWIDFGSSAPQTYTVYTVGPYDDELQDNVTLATETPIVPTPPWQPRLPPSYFQCATAFWVAGMLLNILAIGAYFARAATPALRRRVSETFSLTAALFTAAMVNPEAVRPLADRRRDAMGLRIMGLVPAWCLDFPMLVVTLSILGVYGFNAFLFLVAVSSGTHLLVFFYRALLVAITRGLTRAPLTTEQQRERGLEGGGVSAADLGVMVVTLLHLGLMCALLGLYLHGFYFGPDLGMGHAQADALRVSFWILLCLLVAVTLSSTAIALSFLNHFIFTDATVSERSWRSTAILLLCSLDASWLNLLAQEKVHVREVKRIATSCSVAFVGATLVLQTSVIFMVDIDWAYLDESSYSHLIPGDATQNAAIVFSILCAVCKGMVLTHLQTAQREALREARDRHRGHERDMDMSEHRPFKHCAPWSEQWSRNREPPAGYVDPNAPAPSPYGYTVTGARHYEGYAITEEGDWILDDEGNYTWADGVSFAQDEYGEYVLDAQGGYVLEGLVDEGTTADDYWNGGGEDVTNTSRSTDTLASRGGYGQQGYDQQANAEMLQVTCPKRAVYENEGVQGIFVELVVSQEQPTPYLFIQAYEVVPVTAKAKGTRKNQPQVSVSFSSADTGGYDRDYVQQHVAPDPDAAWQALQAYEDQALNPDYYGGQDYYGQQGYDQQGYDQQAYGQGGYQDQALPADEDPNTAQRL